MCRLGGTLGDLTVMREAKAWMPTYVGMTGGRRRRRGGGPRGTAASDRYGTAVPGHYGTGAPAHYADHQVIVVVSDAVCVMRRVLRR